MPQFALGSLCGNFYRLGACVFLLRGFPLSDRLNSAQCFFLEKKELILAPVLFHKPLKQQVISLQEVEQA